MGRLAQSKYWDDLAKTLPEDDDEAVGAICHHFLRLPNPKSPEEYILRADYAYAFLRAFADMRPHLDLPEVEFTGDEVEDAQRIETLFENLFQTTGVAGTKKRKIRAAKETVEKLQTRFMGKMGAPIVYEFTEDELKEIQALINKLREAISESKDISQNHRYRLLRRVEKLQQELHKTMSDLDRFWGLMIEGSLVVRIMGDNLAPVGKLIDRLFQIIWGIQAKAEGKPALPPPSESLLPKPEEDTAS